VLQLGIESELYVVQPFVGAEPAPADDYLVPSRPTGRLRPTAAYDVEATLDVMDFLDPMVRAMRECGFGAFSFDHEGGDGQVEFDFEYAPALTTADRVTLLRLMAKQIAKQVGLMATFMPKPYTEAWGSGAHFNMSLTDVESGQNLFRDPEDRRGRGWSKAAYGFTAGILRHAPALAAICTPTVNSYKRLQPRLSDGTVSWAPTWASYGDNNRSCLLRLPRNRPAIENRGVDSAANPYLTAAFLLAAGLEGVAEGLDPGDPVEDLTYDWTSSGPSGGDVTATRLPRNLLEAIEAFNADPLTHRVFPAEFVRAYVDMKVAEWDAYHTRVSEWERETYLTMF
jgi:glutamine synthetase